MSRLSQPIGWRLTDPQPQTEPTIRREDLAAELTPEADAREHSAAIKPVDLLKTRATGEGLAWAEADLAGAAAVAAAEVVEEVAVVVEAEAAEEAVADAAEAAGDDASWRFGPLLRILRNQNVLKEPRTHRD
jgi:hypothetical protein